MWQRSARTQGAEAKLSVAEERERATQALHAQERRFDTALNHMLQGLLMFDDDRPAAGRQPSVSTSMFGVPDGVLTPGMFVSRAD